MLPHSCRHAHHFKAALLLCGVFAPFIATAAHADTSGSVTGVGTLGGLSSSANGVSSDGSTVAGQSYLGDNSSRAFIWTQGGGIVSLGTLGGTNSEGLGISGDGSTVVGDSDVTGDTATHAFRWTQGTGMTDLSTLGGTNSQAAATSNDGSVVVGNSDIASDVAVHAFRWTQGSGMLDLGTLGGNLSYAAGVSGDGSVVVGYSSIANSNTHAFRWTQANSLVDLGTLGGTNSYATAVSSDGGTTVGYSDITSNATQHAFSWTTANGLTDLGTLVGASQASAVSSDGSIIVGNAIASDTNPHAFRWTQTTGLQDLNTLLSSSGVDMSQTLLYNANGISANGAYIVGQGDLNGTTEGYIAYYQNNIGGVTTAASQQASVQGLSGAQNANMVGSRSMSNALLGMMRPVDRSSYIYSGAMFGSAFGFAGAQLSRNHLTFLGGLGFGQSDYPNVTQGNAPTLALAGRYTFDTANTQIHPYGEIGGWITPRQTLTFSRTYVNGSGTATGSGDTTGTQFAGYLRGGTVWDFSDNGQINGFAEFGQQYLAFDGYSEGLSASNPFPATVQAGTASMDVIRGGASYTQRYNWWLSTTVTGALAHAFNVDPDLNVNVAPIGTMSTSGQDFTWFEFGTRFETRITSNLSLALLLDGTTGGDEIGTKVHGGAALTYGF